MLTTLDQIQPGGSCRIAKVTYADLLGARLMNMGVYPGSMLRVVRNAPLRDPMEVEVNDIYLSLRREEARFIEVICA